MSLLRRTLLSVTLLLLPVSSLRAQTADPSGHWEGSLQVPGLEHNVEVDLAKNSTGTLAGTISIPAEHLTALPLLMVAVEGKAVRFSARQDQTFDGALSDDGKWIVGELKIEGFELPLTFARKGEARIEAPARSAPIGKELEGTWNATMAAGGTSMRIVLTMTNEPDGRAMGRLVNLDEGGLQIPIATITQKDSSLTLDVKAVGGSYSGALNEAATELVGKWTQGASVVPLNFRRAATPDGNK